MVSFYLFDLLNFCDNCFYSSDALKLINNRRIIDVKIKKDKHFDELYLNNRCIFNRIFWYRFLFINTDKEIIRIG